MSLPYLPPFEFEYCPSKKRANPHRCYTQEEARDIAELRTRPGQLWTFWPCGLCHSYHVGKPSKTQLRNFQNAIRKEHPEIAKALQAYLDMKTHTNRELNGDNVEELPRNPRTGVA